MKVNLHFDINSTIYMADPVNNKEMEYVFQCALAEDPKYQGMWESQQPHHMTFYDYVHKYKDWGADCPKITKLMKKMAIEGFVNRLESMKSPMHKEISERYNKVLSVMRDHKLKVAPAFYKLIDWLESQKSEGKFDYQIILRTFGEDLEDIRSEVEKNTSLEFAQSGAFNKRTYSVNGSDKQHDLRATYELWDATKGHIAVQDDFKTWTDNSKHWQFGKIFPLDSLSSDSLSVFFDDNIFTNRGDESIIAPYCVGQSKFIPVAEALEHKLAHVVHSVEAIENPDYFIERVKASLKNHVKQEAKPAVLKAFEAHKASSSSSGSPSPAEDTLDSVNVGGYALRSSASRNNRTT